MKIIYYKNPESLYLPIDKTVLSEEDSFVVKEFDAETEFLYIKDCLPDIVIFEESVIPFGAEAFFEMFSSDELCLPKILVYHPSTDSVSSESEIPKKPFGRFDIVDSVVSDYNCFDKYGKINTESLVSGMLSELGVSVRVCGYRYLKKAILLSLYKSESSGNITKDIYPVIERHFRVSRGSVERAMRHAIESLWDKNGSLYVRLYFSRRKKPSNSLFISMISENIRYRYDNEIKEEIRISESCRKYARRKSLRKK